MLDSPQEDEKVVKPDTGFFTPLNHAVPKQDGSTLETLFVGSILGERKRMAQRFGKRNRVQSSQTARCHLNVWNVLSHNAEN